MVTRSELLPEGTYLAPRLRVLRVLGEGGMGVVYLARDEALERDVAVKLVDPARVSDEGMRRRFLEEARAMARVRSDAVVEIYAFGERDGAPYFVMEHMADSLHDWLERQGREPLALDVALGILERVALGLEDIHACGTVHGDLKPGNILIGQGFRVCLADFGLATELEAELELVGTPTYLAPERIRGDDLPPELRARGDLYALGVLAFELLAGEVPFDAPDVGRVYAQHLYKPIPSLTELRPDLPPALDHAVRALLAKRPEDRPSSADPLLDALRAARRRAEAKVSHVLVVDDDPDFRALVRACIEEELGACTVEESDGTDALTRLADRRFDLVVLDLHMPDMNGIELTAAIRERHAREELRILVVTGHGSASDWRILKGLGADAFVVKPLDTDGFVSQARRLLAA
ncbi:MAG: protein kinase [Myxococcales bacterium]|nr:protein kinase [Myxococcales bacterium]